MKKTLFILLIVLPFSIRTKAQVTTFQLMVSELRNLFSNVSNPNPQISFFYDLSPHFVDSAFFHHYCLDTNTASNWFNLYKEMYYMAYDTTLIMKSDTVYQRALPKIQSDTIPIGIIDWNFHLLVPTALTTGNYFIFDTVNNLLYDKPGAPSPYTVQTTFAGSTFRETYPFTNPVFMVDPHYFFKDSYKHYTAVESILKIDFGDGTGWHVFTENSIGHYQAHYGSGGRKTVRYGIFPNQTSTLPIRYAVSTFFITSENPLVPPTTRETLPGMDIFYYGANEDCQPHLNKKYIIYLEGFDPLNNRSAAQVYQEMIVDNEIAQLLNFGYTFVVVNWHDGNDWLENNAMHLVGLIEHLKCTHTHGADGPPQPFVIIGESMSGLIARYALCYMEDPNYTTTCSNTDPGVPHHTRLLITLDAPHQGANIPIGLQYLYRYGVAGTLSAIGFSPWAIGQFSQELAVMNKAATQMLKYHIDTDPFINLPASLSPITEHPNKTAFDNDLDQLGNYPQFCKLAAISNGSWMGTHQPTAWDPQTPRQPNDFILDIQSETYIKVLGIKILGTKLDCQVNTNPQGTGDAFAAKFGISHWKIKLKWFGAKLVWWTDYLVGVDKDVYDVEPYCVMPGSNNNIDLPIGAANTFNSFNLLDFFGFQVQSGNGTIQVNGYLGDPLFGNANLQFHAYSDGGDFGFVPTYSSFDYENAAGFPLDQPILSEPIADNLGQTPFDVVYTNPTETNWGHLVVQNPPLNPYATCPEFTSHLLNREIGDDSLWLENFPTNYITAIECEKDILVNERNIYYNYDSQQPVSPLDNFNIFNYDPNAIPFFGSVAISKEDPMGFNINQELISNDNVWQNPSQPPLYGFYTWQQGNMQICCMDYSLRKANTAHTPGVSVNESSFMKVYPNPANEALTIEYKMSTDDEVTISLYDMVGRKIKEWHPGFDDNSKVCTFNIGASGLDLTAGNYLLTAGNGREVHKTKLVILK